MTHPRRLARRSDADDAPEFEAVQKQLEVCSRRIDLQGEELTQLRVWPNWYHTSLVPFWDYHRAQKYPPAGPHGPDSDPLTAPPNDAL